MTESVIYYNTAMPTPNATVSRYTIHISGRPVAVTQVTGERTAGKSFLAQAIANYLMLNGAAFVLMLDEDGNNYSLSGETGMTGYARHALPREFTLPTLERFLTGRSGVCLVMAGNVPL